MDPRDDENLLVCEKLSETLKELQAQTVKIQMENLWMESFLRENAPSMLPNAEQKPIKNRITFASKMSKSLSVYGTRIQSVSPDVLISSDSISSTLKAEMCQNETFKLQNELEKKQKQSLQAMVELNAKTQEAEISCKEITKTIDEFEKLVLERGFDPMTNRISSDSFISFLKEASRNGKLITESMRMKTQTLKVDYRKQKRLFKKREELVSCLRPVDFQLAKIEKKKFQNLQIEKLHRYKGLREDERDAFMNRNQAQKQLVEDTIQLNQITSKVNLCQRSVDKLEQSVMSSEHEIVELKKSVQELEVMSSTFEGPTVIDYIENINKRDSLKIQLKIAKRKVEVAKVHLQNLKKKLRRLNANQNE